MALTIYFPDFYFNLLLLNTISASTKVSFCARVLNWVLS